MPQEEGLFILREKKTGKTLGIPAVYVDVLTAFGKFIGSTWSTEVTGFIGRSGRKSILFFLPIKQAQTELGCLLCIATKNGSDLGVDCGLSPA